MNGETKAFLAGVIVIAVLVAGLLFGLLIYSAHVRDINLQKWEACQERPTAMCEDILT